MRFFSLLACVMYMGVCHADLPDQVKCGHFKKDKMALQLSEGNSAFGAAGFFPFGQSIMVKEGDTIAPPVAIGHNLGFANGEFIVEQEGDYVAGYLTRLCATNAVLGNVVIMGVAVNGVVVKKDELIPESSKNELYPFQFFGRKNFVLSLKVGDKVSLKLDAVSLVDGASLYLVARDRKGKSMKKPFTVFFLKLGNQMSESSVS